MTPWPRVLQATIVALAGTVTSAEQPYPTDFHFGRHHSMLTSTDPVWTESAYTVQIAGTLRRLEGGLLPRKFIVVDIAACASRVAHVATGGYVTLCLPLVMNLESEDELAFVLAHEMAHVMLGHTLDESSDWSIGQEREADAIAASLVTNAGYSPDGGFTFLEKIETNPGDEAATRMIEGRYDALADLVEDKLIAESEGRSFTALPNSWARAHQRARDYLTAIESIYLDYLRAQKVAMTISGGRGADADKSRAEACRGHFAAMQELARRSGHTPLLLHQVLTIGDLCSFYSGTAERIAEYIDRYVDLTTAPFSEASAVAVGRLLHQSDELLERSANRLVTIAFAESDSMPTMSEEMLGHHRAEALVSSLLAVCGAVGATNWQPVADKFAAETRKRLEYIVAVLGSREDTQVVDKACAQRLSAKAKAVQNERERIFKQRLAMGHTRERAYSMAQVGSSVTAVNGYISDRMALRRAVIETVDAKLDQ